MILIEPLISESESEYIREKLIRAEKSGLSKRTPEQIRTETKKKLKLND